MDSAMLDSFITQIANTGDYYERQQIDWSSLPGNEAAVEPVMRIIVAGDELQRLQIIEAAVRIGKPMILALLKALYHDDSQVRRFAAWNLSHLTHIVEQPPIDRLIELLDDEPSTRWSVMRALGHFHAESAVETIIPNLKHPDKDVRQMAAESLGLIGDPRAVEPLIEALEDSEGMVRDWAIESLGLIGDERAVEPLERVMVSNPDRVYAAAYALSRLDNGPDFGLVANLLQSDDAALRGIATSLVAKVRDPHLVESLIELLQHEDQYVQLKAAIALGEIGDAQAIDPLIILINRAIDNLSTITISPTNFVRALAQIDDERASSYLNYLLQHPDLRHQSIAIMGIAISDKEEKISLILNHMESPNLPQPILLLAFNCLIVTRYVNVVTSLLEHFFDDPRLDMVSWILSRRILETSETIILEWLIERLMSSTSNQRLRVLNVFKRMKADEQNFYEQDDDLVYGSDMDTILQERLEKYIANVRSSIVMPLIAALRTEQAKGDPRSWLIEAIVALGEASIEPLREVYRTDSDPDVRAMAGEALERLGQNL